MTVRDYNPTRAPRTVFLLFALGIVVSLPSLLWHKWPSPDAAIYYLPMIREFARGNWGGAFYPMIPPFFIVAVGLLSTALFIPALYAAKLVSILCFAGSVFPLYRILRPIYGRRTAELGCLLMILCARLIRDGAAPLLDSTKMFLFLWVVAMVFESYRSSRLTYGRAILMVPPLAGLALVRGEGLALSLLALVALAMAECRQLRQRPADAKPGWTKLVPRKTMAATLLFAVLALPWALYVYRQTGYPALDSRQIEMLRKIPGVEGLAHAEPKQIDEPETLESLLDAQPRLRSSQPRGRSRRSFATLHNSLLAELYKGVYRYYIPLYLIGLLVRIRGGKWARRESALLVVFVGHTALIVTALGGLWTQARYILPAMPLLLGWAALGLQTAVQPLLATERRPLRHGALAIAGLALLLTIYSGNQNAFDFLRRSAPHRRATMESEDDEWYTPILDAAAWFRARDFAESAASRPSLQSTTRQYHPGRRPLLLTASPQLPFLAEADAVFLDFYRYDFSLDSLLRFARFKTVDYIVTDRQWRNLSPIDAGLLQSSSEVEPVAVFGEGLHQVHIFKLR